jgi:hypothetical protein
VSFLHTHTTREKRKAASRKLNKERGGGKVKEGEETKVTVIIHR